MSDRDEGSVEISTDPARLDLSQIHDFLVGSYWASGRTRDAIERSIRHSLCFGAYSGTRQVGFARAVTDRATFAYLADVFVVPAWRGRGIAKQLVRAALGHPELDAVNWLLRTRDAHGLYRQFGFEPIAGPERYLERPCRRGTADAGIATP